MSVTVPGGSLSSTLEIPTALNWQTTYPAFLVTVGYNDFRGNATNWNEQRFWLRVYIPVTVSAEFPRGSNLTGQDFSFVSGGVRYSRSTIQSIYNGQMGLTYGAKADGRWSFDWSFSDQGWWTRSGTNQSDGLVASPPPTFHCGLWGGWTSNQWAISDDYTLSETEVVAWRSSSTPFHPWDPRESPSEIVFETGSHTYTLTWHSAYCQYARQWSGYKQYRNWDFYTWSRA